MRLLRAAAALLLALTLTPPAYASPAPIVAPAVAIRPVNFRPVADLNPGVLYRSGKLSRATAADRRYLAGLLAGGTIIDLRTRAKMKSSPDPRLPGVTRVPIPLSPGSYSRFVTDPKRRAAIGKAIRTVAYARGPVLIHCTYGRDRTGWTVAVIYLALGLPEATVRAEYLRSSGATNRKLNSGLAAIRARGGLDRYLVALGLTGADLAALRAKLTN